MRRSIFVVMDGKPEAAFFDPREPEQLGVRPCWRSNGMRESGAKQLDADFGADRSRVRFRLPRRLSRSELTPTPPDVWAWLKGHLPQGCAAGSGWKASHPKRYSVWERDMAWDAMYPLAGLGKPLDLPRRLTQFQRNEARRLENARRNVERLAGRLSDTLGGAHLIQAGLLATRHMNEVEKTAADAGLMNGYTGDLLGGLFDMARAFTGAMPSARLLSKILQDPEPT